MHLTSGKSKQNAVKSMVVTDGDGRVLFCSPTRPGSRAGITAVEILADAGCQGLGAQTGSASARHTHHAVSGSNTATPI
ncbi:hypothetical protein [Streptomyces sp. SudanB52_2052]|uniref:hypothetical protein n=1 Tax=Streptomyces sp. SudanB52_2052 TaxID=3035276 RepID=UPI003F54B1FB